MACKEPTNENIKALAEAYIKATAEGNSKIRAGKLVTKDSKLTKRVYEGVAEVYTSGLISGYTTHAVNAFSSLLYQVFQPSQKAVGRLLMGEPKEAMGELLQVYDAFSQTLPAAKMAYRSMRDERQFLDQKSAYIDQMGPAKAMSADALGINKAKHPIAAKGIDALGTVGRVTGHRVMGGVDELFSQMNYRGYIRNQFMRRAMREGKSYQEIIKAGIQGSENHMTRFYKAGSLDGVNSSKRKLFTSKELSPEELLTNDANKIFNDDLKAKYEAEKVVGDSLNKDQKEFNKKLDKQYNAEKKRVVNERGLTDLEDGINTEATKHNEAIQMHEEALTHARELGFKDNLDPDASTIQAIGAGLSTLMERFPLGRIAVLPFIRTPTWLLEIGVRNTPLLQLANKAWRKDFSGVNGAAKEAQAKGQLLTAGLMTGLAIPMIENGTITGSISSDWKVNQNASEAGVHPYSAIFKDSDGTEHSVQYNYLDPIMFGIGVLADTRQEMRKREIDWEDLVNDKASIEAYEKLAASIGLAASHYFYNKSYFQGMAGLFDVLGEDPDRQGDALARWARKQAAGFVPNMLSQTNQMHIDESRREVRTLAEAFKARLPILSKTLPLKYDPLGIPIKHPNRFYAGLPLKNSKVSNKKDRKKKDDYVKAEILRLAVKTDIPVRPFSPNTASYKMDYREYFPFGSKEGKSGQSFFDAVNMQIFEEGKVTDEVFNLVSNKDYQALEGQTVEAFGSILGEEVDPNEYGSNQMKAINAILKSHRDRVVGELLSTDKWAHVRDDFIKHQVGYDLQR